MAGRILLHCLFFLLSLILTFPTMANTATEKPSRAEVPFQTTRGLIVVRAKMAARSGNFVLDTGAELTLVETGFLGLREPGNGLSPIAIPGGNSEKEQT